MRPAVLALASGACLLAQTVSPPANSTGLPGWMKFGAELRGRAEAQRGAGFVSGANDTYYLHRLRLNAAFQPARLLRVFVQVQDSQAPALSRRPAPAGTVNTLDLRQGYLELGSSEKGPLALRVGRQDLIFGEERLVGAGGWGNVGRPFDAVRLTVGRPGARLDAFAACLTPVVNGRFDRPRLQNGFYGIYGSFDKFVPDAVLEPYALWKTAARVVGESGAAGDLDVWTLGVRWVGKRGPTWDYGTELAIQRGHAARDRIQAWAGHFRFGYRPGRDGPWRLVAEYNYASGDRDPRDQRRGVFDQLYPTNHNKYGTADQIGWRNIHDLAPALEWRPHRRWRLRFEHHQFWLADRRDALYTEAGAVFVRNPRASSSHVGWELNAQADWQISERLQLGAGLAHLFPGAYLKQSTPGAGFSYPYLMWSYRF